MTTVFTAPEASGLTTGFWTSLTGRQYVLLPLSPAGEPECVALAALIARGESVTAEYWALSAAISSWLQELGDLPGPRSRR